MARWSNRRPEQLLLGPATQYATHSGAHPPRKHVRQKHGWDCDVCGAEWPCDQARAELRHEHRETPHALAVLMAGHLGEAVRDLPYETPKDLFERFVEWTRP